MTTKKALTSYFRRPDGLKADCESDPRLGHCRPNGKPITEYTLQAIIWSHLTEFAKGEWLFSIEECVPGTDFKADILAYKMNKGGGFNQTTGTIAVEVKPNGRRKGLIKDVEKLSEYVDAMGNDVNFGVLIYPSPYMSLERTLKMRAEELAPRRIKVIRLDRRKARKA